MKDNNNESYYLDSTSAYVTGFVRSGNTYTANGAAEMIKEIVANIKADDLEIMFRMDSGYFDEEIIELRYVFLAAKIIKTARNVILNLSFNYPYRSVYEKCLTRGR